MYSIILERLSTTAIIDVVNLWLTVSVYANLRRELRNGKDHWTPLRKIMAGK